MTIHQVYFEIPEVCHSLQKQTKEDFLREVNRDTPTDKIDDFMAKVDSLQKNIVHQNNIKNHKFRFIPLYSEVWRNILLLITLAINVR